MARFDEHAPPGDWSMKSYEDIARLDKMFEELMAQSDALTEEQIQAGQVLGGLIRFGVADGYAVYRVCKLKPLTLQHVPVGDAWSVHSATIRGLRMADIQKELLDELHWRTKYGGEP